MHSNAQIKWLLIDWANRLQVWGLSSFRLAFESLSLLTIDHLESKWPMIIPIFCGFLIVGVIETVVVDVIFGGLWVMMVTLIQVVIVVVVLLVVLQATIVLLLQVMALALVLVDVG